MSILDTIDMPAHVPAFALLTALSGTVLCGLALVAGKVLRHGSPAFRYVVLFGGVIGLLAAPVLVATGQSMDWLFAVTRFETVTIPADRVDDILSSPAPEVAPAPAEIASSWSELAGLGLIGIWAAGIIIGLLGLVRGLCKFRGAFTGAPWRADWWTDARRGTLAGKVGLKAFPPVWQSPLAPMPMVIGLCRPQIIVPEAAPVSWTQAQWEAVLLHEAAHIARRDPWAALAQRLAGVIFWWCPLMRFLERRLNNLRETICDDYALAGSCERLAYATLLVEAAERLVLLRALPIPIGLLDSARGGLEERITCLLNKENPPMTKLSLAGKLLSAGVLTAACLAISAATAFSQAPPAQKKIQVKIVVDGKEIELTDEVLQALLAAKQNERQARFTQSIPVQVHLQSVSDPRIEALVRQAEEIKPGSGAAIRQALEAKERNVLWLRAVEKLDLAALKAKEQRAARIEEVVKMAEMLAPGSGEGIRKLMQSNAPMQAGRETRVIWGASTKQPEPAPGVRVPANPALPAPGGERKTAPTNLMMPPAARLPQDKEKVLVQVDIGGNTLKFYVDNGKVRQLLGEDMVNLKKKAETRHGPPVLPGAPAPLTAENARKALTPPANPGGLAAPKDSSRANPAGTPAPGRDLEVLTRELQRLTAEVNELRQRIERSKRN